MVVAMRTHQTILLEEPPFPGFSDLLAGRLAQLPGECATMSDWANHLSTLFPEVRLKSYLEMRGADGGPWSRICALQGLWAGVLYDAPSLAAAWEARPWANWIRAGS